MGGVLSSDKSPSKSPTKSSGSPKKRLGSSSSPQDSPVKGQDSPVKCQESPVKAAADDALPVPEIREPEPTTPPKPDEIIPVTDEEIASVEAAVKDQTKKDNSLRYEVLLSPAVKKVTPRITPPTSPITENDITKKLKEAEERRQSLDNIRMKNLSAQLARVELAQQKKEELVTEKSSKALEVLSSKLSVAEEKRTSQLQEVKDKLSGHMEKIEKAQKELENQLEEARAAAEASLTEKMESHKKRKDEEMEEMLKKIQEHQEKISKVRSNQEDRLKPYVTELENSIKEKLDRAAQAKERQEKQLIEKLAEQSKKAELVRQNKERLMAEANQAETNQTTESA